MQAALGFGSLDWHNFQASAPEEHPGSSAKSFVLQPEKSYWYCSPGKPVVPSQGSGSEVEGFLLQLGYRPAE